MMLKKLNIPLIQESELDCKILKRLYNCLNINPKYADSDRQIGA